MEDGLHYMANYIDCSHNSVERVGGMPGYDPEREDLANTANVSMVHRYIQTPLDREIENFQEARQVKHYSENECWFDDCFV